MDAEGEVCVPLPDVKAASAPGDPAPSSMENARLASEFKTEGNALYKAGKYRDAIQKYTRAIELCPEEASYLGNRGAAYLMIEDYSLALADSIAAIALDPYFVKAYIRAMKCHIALGQLDQVGPLVKSADGRVSSSFDVQNEVLRANKLKRALEGCSVAVVNGKAASELPRIQTLCKEMPACAKVQVLLVEAFMARNKHDDAVSLCSTFLRRNPASMQLQRLRASAFYHLGRFDQATARLQEALRQDPDNKECVSLFKTIKRLTKAKELGNAAFKAGRLQEAYERYTEALAIDPANVQFNALLYCNRAAVAIKQKLFKEALSDCNACLDVDSGNVKALCRRATAYLETEQYEEAVRDLENAKKLSDGDRDICEQLRHAQLELAKSKRKDHYKTLGVSKDCDETDIKKAYRRLALQYHPDKNHGCSDEEKAAAEAKFKDICEANEILSDPQKRRRYDSGADLEMGGMHGHHGSHMDMNDVFQMFFQSQGAGGFSQFGGGSHGFSQFGGSSHHFSF